jgi:hypothetical protein
MTKTEYMRLWSAKNRERKREIDRQSYLRRREKVLEKRRAVTKERAAIARAYVKEQREATMCSSCGAQPIEYHEKTHPQEPHRRINAMVSNGQSIAAIAVEIKRCTPLCRKCHRAVDFKGRKRDKNRGLVR